MTHYNLRSLPLRDYAAINAGMDLEEHKAFQDSFDFPQETVPPGPVMEILPVSPPLPSLQIDERMAPKTRSPS